MYIAKMSFRVITVLSLILFNLQLPDNAKAQLDLNSHSLTQNNSDSYVMINHIGWQYEVEIINPVTITYESIYFKVTVTNLRHEPTISPIINYALGHFRMQLLDGEGASISLLRIRINQLGRPDTSRVLRPGESFTTTINLRNLLSFNDNVARGDIPKLVPGNYTILMEQCFDPILIRPKNADMIPLPSLRFRVVAPQGRAAEAYGIFREANLATFTDHSAAMELYETIMRDYSDTPYDELTNEHLLSLLVYGAFYDHDKLIALRIRFLEKYPDSPQNIGNVGELIPRITPERMRALCRKLLSNPKASSIISTLREQHPWLFEGEDK